MDRYALGIKEGVQSQTDLDIAFGCDLDEVGPPGAIPQITRFLNRYYRYPLRLRARDCSLLHVLDHSYGHLVENVSARRSIVTVHDLYPAILLKRPARGIRDRLRNRYLAKVMRGVCRADAWIVSTEWMRGELSAYLGREDGIHVVPYGVARRFFDPPAEGTRDRVRERLGLTASTKIVLHVGSLVERKNFPAIVGTLRQLRSDGTDAHLLQVGGSLSLEQRALLESHEMSGHATFVGGVADDDLPGYYAASDVLLFPSFYEGFGLPIIEAMASGLPVVASGAGGSAEITGDAGIVVTTREITPYVDAVAKLLQDDQYRNDLIARGRARAQEFTWQACADRTLAIYRELLGQ